MASEVITSWQRLERELNYTLTEYTFVSAFCFFGGLCFPNFLQNFLSLSFPAALSGTWQPIPAHFLTL